MTDQIRRLGLLLMVLLAAILVNLTWIQVVKGPRLAEDPRNTRVAVRDFSRPRGTVSLRDGTVLARSVPAADGFQRLRQYPEGELFAGITGYFSFTYGTDGVERSYAPALTGRDVGVGLKQLKDLFVAKDRTADVVLTVRKDLQQVAAQGLGQRRGSVVALDPRDGSVLALYSWPTYDPNALAQHDQRAVQRAYNLLRLNPDRPLLPRSYRERFAPGSTFKVVTSAAAYERAPDLTTRVYPQLSQLDLPQTTRNLRNFGGEVCGGTLPDLLRVSCNTGFAQIGLDLGAGALAGEAQDFGFGAAAPLDLPAVARSVFPDAAAFARNLPALAQSAIGQRDVAATPIEMALVAAGIANGGTVMAPHVLAEVRDHDDGTVLRTAAPRVWRRATTPEAAGAVRDAMLQVVERGTGTRARIQGVPVAGKTGTAQTSGNRAHAWFIAFAPADAPRVAVAVIVESQPGLGDSTGGAIAAPIARSVLLTALGSG